MYKRDTETNHDDVGLFHAKFGLDNTTLDGEGPREVDRELLEFRIRFLFEEVMEFAKAAGYDVTIDPPLTSDGLGELRMLRFTDKMDHAKMFDALIDEAYVVHGAAHLLGYPWQEGWRRVQAANMAKERATRADQSERGGTWDVIKPPGWRAPDIESLLQSYGWDINQ